jgi:hypothetical protein
MAKLTLNTIGSRYGSIDALNDNSDLVEAALENTLSRDGTGPNNMESDLDMDSNRIINLSNGSHPQDAVTKNQLDVNKAEVNALVQSLSTSPYGDAANVSYIPAGVSAVPTTVQTKLRETVSVKDFGAVGDGVTDDTAAIQAAIDSLIAYQGVSFTPGSYKTNGVINVTTSDIGIDFGTATFLVGDTGANGTTTTGATGKIGFLFKQADNISIIGSPKFIGQGTAGVTSLAGLVFDDCDNVHAPAEMYFENMAAGRFISRCTNSSFGTVTGKTLNGLQTFESPPTTTQGSLEVVIGCVNCIFDDLFCEGNILPARYFSIGAASPNNEFCKTGTTISITTGNTATALAIRSAVNCCFGDVSGSGLTAAILLAIYVGNTAWDIDKNTFGNITATLVNTGASEDAVVYSFSEEPTKTIGKNAFGNLVASGSGEFGLFVNSGVLSFGNIDLDGFKTPIRLRTSSFIANSAKITGQANEAIVYGQGANVSIQTVQILTGSTNIITGAIRFNSASGTGGIGIISFGEIQYRYNAIGNDYLYIVFDLTNGFESTQINSINGGGSSGKQARFASDEFFVKNGVWSGIAIPTTGTYSVGTVLMKSNAVAGGVPGHVCTTAGTPGTWKAMANLAV